MAGKTDNDMAQRQITNLLYGFQKLILDYRLLQPSAVTFNFEKKWETAIEPKKSFEKAAGIDIFIPYDCTLPPNERVRIDTGIIPKFPDGIYGKISDRSSLACIRGIDVVGSGLIDMDYRGTLIVYLRNTNKETVVRLSRGERIAQLVLHQYIPVVIQEVKKIPTNTERGEGGFGSSGR